MLAAQAGPRPHAKRNQIRPSFREWVRRRRKKGAIGDIESELIDRWKSRRLHRVRIRPESFESDLTRLQSHLLKYMITRKDATEATPIVIDTPISEYATEVSPDGSPVGR
jgi:hypothetical protein